VGYISIVSDRPGLALEGDNGRGNSDLAECEPGQFWMKTVGQNWVNVNTRST